MVLNIMNRCGKIFSNKKNDMSVKPRIKIQEATLCVIIKSKKSKSLYYKLQVHLSTDFMILINKFIINGYSSKSHLGVKNYWF